MPSKEKSKAVIIADMLAERLILWAIWLRRRKSTLRKTNEEVD